MNFTQNTALIGGVNNNNGNINITQSNFNNNTATIGAITYNTKANITIKQSNHTTNNATTAIIYNLNGNLIIENSTLTNSMDNDNLTIYNIGYLTITNTNISNNYQNHPVNTNITIRSPIKDMNLPEDTIINFTTKHEIPRNKKPKQHNRNNNSIQTNRKPNSKCKLPKHRNK